MSTGGSPLKFVLVADGQRFENVIARQQREIRKLGIEMAKLGNASRKGTKESVRGMQGLDRSVTSLAVKYGVAQRAIALFNTSLENQQRLLRETQQKATDLGAAQNRIGFALGGAATEEQKARLANIILDVGRTRVKRFTDVELTETAKFITSKTGGDPENRIRAVRDILKFADRFAATKGEAGPALGAALGVGRQIGGQDPDLTRKQQREIIGKAAFLTAGVISEAAITDPKSLQSFETLASNVQSFDVNDDRLKGMAKARARFGSLRFATALFAASTTAFDPRGPEAATFGAQQIAAINELLPTDDVIDASGRIKKRRRVSIRGERLETTEQKLRAVFEGAKTDTGRVFTPVDLERQLLVGAKGDPKLVETRKKFLGRVRELFKGGEFQDLFKRSFAATPSFDEASEERFFQQIEEDFRLTKDTRRFSRRLENEARVERKLREQDPVRSEVQALIFGEKGILRTQANTFREQMELSLAEFFFKLGPTFGLTGRQVLEQQLALPGFLSGATDADRDAIRKGIETIAVIEADNAQILGNVRGNALSGAAETGGQTEGR